MSYLGSVSNNPAHTELAQAGFETLQSQFVSIKSRFKSVGAFDGVGSYLYSFALSNPSVDLVLTGMQDRNEIDQALRGLEKGPFSEEECQFLRMYGSIYNHKKRLMN